MLARDGDIRLGLAARTTRLGSLFFSHFMSQEFQPQDPPYERAFIGQGRVPGSSPSGVSGVCEGGTWGVATFTFDVRGKSHHTPLP